VTFQNTFPVEIEALLRGAPTSAVVGLSADA